MSSISKHTGDNLGGIARLSYALEQLATPHIDTTGTSIQLSQADLDTYFHTIEPHHFAAGYIQQRTNGPNGPSWTITVGLTIIGDRQEIRDQVELVLDRKLWIYLTDRNGQQLLIGHAGEGIVQAETLSSGQQVSELAGYDYQVQGTLTRKMRPVTLLG